MHREHVGLQISKVGERNPVRVLFLLMLVDFLLLFHR